MSIIPAETIEADPIFYRTGFAASEIELGAKILNRKIADLQRANETGSAVDQKLASEAIAKLAGQIQALADVVVRVTVGHLNRNARVS